ncbi:hypothetical protein Pst134EA_015639 [Puccinia striiformis f. sp. tritici]|uniref:hypothetical protein n=1 Tax=Puccinia striiformis f. sp. tritici TaxID=168172 RepID=UPI0020072A7E|nr:hypothetical protein Pst134EA_015639 [Puccinia striiformis f. sp. tritici]KAH9463549.1 hypothetical protein Pst134EA_015639 [Puccinia striiformis f. sp. tritici]
MFSPGQIVFKREDLSNAVNASRRVHTRSVNLTLSKWFPIPGLHVCIGIRQPQQKIDRLSFLSLPPQKNRRLYKLHSNLPPYSSKTFDVFFCLLMSTTKGIRKKRKSRAYCPLGLIQRPDKGMEKKQVNTTYNLLYLVLFW